MTKLEHALEDCLTRLASGEARLEDCLAGYPEHAEELRRLLIAVAGVERGRTVSSPPGFKARGHARLAAHMATHPRAGVQWRPWPQVRSSIRSARMPPLKFRLAFGLAALVALFLVVGTALAQGALPGRAGYAWKIASERVWRVFQPDPLAADLFLANRRADELALVTGDPRAKAIALQNYRQALETLSHYTLPASQPLIHQALVAQQHALNQAGLDVRELNELLTPSPSGLAPPQPTPAPSPGSNSARSTPMLPTALPTLGSASSTKPRSPTLSLPFPTGNRILPEG